MHSSSTNRSNTNAASYTGQPSRGDTSAYAASSPYYQSSSSTARQTEYSSNQSSHVYTVASSRPQGYISQYDSSPEYHSSRRSGNHSHGHPDYAQPQSSNYSQPASFPPTLPQGQHAHSGQPRVHSSNAYDMRDQTQYTPPGIFPRSSHAESGFDAASSGRSGTTAPSQGHMRQSSLPSSSSGGDRYTCTHCGRSFSRAHDRKRHEDGQHLSQARPVCPTCHKEFSRPDSLKRHRDNGCDALEGRRS